MPRIHPQLTQAESQLDQYRARYQNRLKAKNLSYIRQILVIVRAFIKLLQNPHAWPASASAGAAGAAVAATSSSLALPTFTHHATQESEEKTQISTSNDFLFATKIDNMNLFKIEKYIQRSEIVKKVRTFVPRKISFAPYLCMGGSSCLLMTTLVPCVRVVLRGVVCHRS